ncbi:MAG: hypothetical protein Q7V17_16960 [Afipia sp.]|nr:hypothetical protein [Afipia sp.]
MLSGLLTSFRQPAAAGSATGDGTHYLFKSSLAGGAKQLTLSDAGLTVQATKTELWPLESIAAIRLSYRPTSMQAWRFRADIETLSGQSIKVFSTTWHSISQMVRQDDDYRAFITELHRRLGSINSNARLTTGINPVLYTVGLVAMALIGLSIAGLFVRALVTAEFAGALFLVAFAGWFIWQIGNFMRRNRPRGYTFDTLPKDVLP